MFAQRYQDCGDTGVRSNQRCELKHLEITLERNAHESDEKYSQHLMDGIKMLECIVIQAMFLDWTTQYYIDFKS
jgi:hypothetical protein